MGDVAWRKTLYELREILEFLRLEPPARAGAVGPERARRRERSAAEPGEVEPVDREFGTGSCEPEDERSALDPGFADVGDAEGLRVERERDVIAFRERSGGVEARQRLDVERVGGEVRVDPALRCAGGKRDRDRARQNRSPDGDFQGIRGDALCARPDIAGGGEACGGRRLGQSLGPPREGPGALALPRPAAEPRRIFGRNVQPPLEARRGASLYMALASNARATRQAEVEARRERRARLRLDRSGEPIERAAAENGGGDGEARIDRNWRTPAQRVRKHVHDQPRRALGRNGVLALAAQERVEIGFLRLGVDCQPERIRGERGQTLGAQSPLLGTEAEAGVCEPRAVEGCGKPPRRSPWQRAFDAGRGSVERKSAVRPEAGRAEDRRRSVELERWPCRPGVDREADRRPVRPGRLRDETKDDRRAAGARRLAHEVIGACDSERVAGERDAVDRERVRSGRIENPDRPVADREAVEADFPGGSGRGHGRNQRPVARAGQGQDRLFEFDVGEAQRAACELDERKLEPRSGEGQSRGAWAGGGRRSPADFEIGGRQEAQRHWTGKRHRAAGEALEARSDVVPMRRPVDEIGHDQRRRQHDDEHDRDDGQDDAQRPTIWVRPRGKPARPGVIPSQNRAKI